KILICLFAIVPYLSGILLVGLILRFGRKKEIIEQRLVWGPSPIINNSYWSRAMALIGYYSKSYTTGFYGTINKREDWDVIVAEKFCLVPAFLKKYLCFLDALVKYDVFFIPFHGFLLGGTFLWRLEAFFLKLAKKK